jgi:polyribonucleotide nucleotidyltransferase
LPCGREIVMESGHSVQGALCRGALQGDRYDDRFAKKERQMHKEVREIGGSVLTVETGRLAKQAHGSVWIEYGDTSVLVTAVSDRLREGVDFVPLTVDYQEMAYAAGKIPGGFFKREGRSSDREILVSRLIDRPIRPLFPKGYSHEVQVIATVMSADMDHLPDILAINGASAALTLSDIPFLGPIGAVRMGRVGGQWIVNPGEKQLEESDVNLIVAGTREAVVMVEGGARMVPEREILDGIFLGHHAIQPLIEMQEELRRAAGIPKRAFEAAEPPEELRSKVREMALEEMDRALRLQHKKERRARIAELEAKVLGALLDAYPGEENAIRALLEGIEREVARRMILEEGRRIDGRAFNQVRPISCEVGLLPRAHGSGLFTRGETQVMAVATLGTASDEQRIDTLSEEEARKSFILHYRFPPFSVGETKPLRAPSRREVGHGALAERAISPILPRWEDFPYTLRVVAEVLESNGSSSMASTCGTTLALMDAGVPILAPVAGVAMGLVKEGDRVVILTDILGDEDHIGDMDFKVTGTSEGITALQMDIKIQGVTREIMEGAMAQAREGRLHILQKMTEVIPAPRAELSPYAPRILTIQIKPDKIRDVIGPGGRVIRKITEETGAKIEVEDDGTIHIASTNMEKAEKAVQYIRRLTEEAEVGGVYTGKVKRVLDFGAIVEILPGTDGLLHISQLDHTHTRKVTDVIQEGDEVQVKVLEIDEYGKIRLSRKALLEEPAEGRASPEGERGPRGTSGERRDVRPMRHGKGSGRGHGREDSSRERR